MLRSLIRLYNRIALTLYGRSLNKEPFSVRNGYCIWRPRMKHQLKYHLPYLNLHLGLTIKYTCIHLNPQTDKWAWSFEGKTSRPFSHWSFAERNATAYLQLIGWTPVDFQIVRNIRQLKETWSNP